MHSYGLVEELHKRKPMMALLGLPRTLHLATRVSRQAPTSAVLNGTLSLPDAQTCFACVQGKSPSLSRLAGGNEMLVMGFGFEPKTFGL
jgi:hypothetical protein